MELIFGEFKGKIFGEFNGIIMADSMSNFRINIRDKMFFTAQRKLSEINRF